MDYDYMDRLTAAYDVIARHGLVHGHAEVLAAAKQLVNLSSYRGAPLDTPEKAPETPSDQG